MGFAVFLICGLFTKINIIVHDNVKFKTFLLITNNNVDGLADLEMIMW